MRSKNLKSEHAPIRRVKLSEEVRHRILASIDENRLKPGDHLPSEREMMTRFQVGRPAIREAMQALQNIGIIEVRHGERPKVAQPSLDHLNEQLSLTMRHVLMHNSAMLDQIKDARILLESQMVRVAATRRTESDLIALRAIIAEQRQNEQDATKFVELDGRFHTAIASISSNDIATSITSSIFGWMEQFHIDWVQTPGLESVSLAEHDAIVEAIETRDPDKAEQAMQRHLTRANRLYSQQHYS